MFFPFDPLRGVPTCVRLRLAVLLLAASWCLHEAAVVNSLHLSYSVFHTWPLFSPGSSLPRRLPPALFRFPSLSSVVTATTAMFGAFVAPAGGALRARPPRALETRRRCPTDRRGALSPSPRCMAAASPPPPSGASPGGDANPSESESLAAFRASLTASAAAEAAAEAAAAAESLDGYKLRDLLVERYGKSYDVTIRVSPWISGKSILSVNIMWHYQEQVSFPMSELEYLEHLEAISAYLNKWGAAGKFVRYVRATKERPRVAKAVAVPIEDIAPEHLKEWL